jgi:predicted phage terminase large subunit-like protein
MPVALPIRRVALTQREEDAQLRLDFAAFAQRCFRELNPLVALAMNWHFEVIAAKLAAVRAGEIRRLIVNVPPRYLKSLLGSVAFPAWCLGRQPGTQIVCASYAQDLADKLVRDCRHIIMSDWFQRAFSTRLSAQRQAVSEFETTQRGCRLATSVGGVLTRRGADLIIIDDPLKPEEALSQAHRRAANEWFDHTLYSRLNDKQKGAIILIMHRLHESLPSGLTRGMIWSATCWPRRTGRSCASRQSPRRTRPGRSRRCGGRGILPGAGARHCTPSATRRKCSNRSAARSANIISPANTSRPPRHWEAVSSSGPGSGITCLVNCPRASTASCRAGTPPTRRPSSAPTLPSPACGGGNGRGCTSWGIKGKDLYLIDVLRRRMEYPELKRAVREQYDRFRPNVVLIEDKASGTQLIQELIREGLYAVTRYRPQSDKVMRMHAQTAMLENGFVRVPERAPWLAQYLEELTVFPNGRHDDQVDSTAQLLDWFKDGGGPSSNAGIFELYRRRAEELRRGQTPGPLVLLQAPRGISHVQLFSGIHRAVAADGTVEMTEFDAAPLLNAGWARVDADNQDGTGSTGLT